MQKRVMCIMTALLIIFSFSAVFAQNIGTTTLSTLTEIAEYASSSSLEYRKALLNLEKTEQSLVSVLKIDSASIGLSSSYTSASQPGENGLSYSGSLNLPVFDQLSLSLIVSDDLSGEASVNINPLFHSDAAAQALLNYKKAKASAESIKASASLKAVKAALAWTLADEKLEIQKSAEDLAKRKYEDEKVRYEKGAVTLDALNSALKNWISARNNLIGLQQKNAQAELDFYSSISANPQDVKFVKTDLSELEKEITALKKIMDTKKANPSALYSVQSALMDVESSKLKKNAIWIFEPELSVNAGIGFSPGNELTYKAGLNLTFSLDSWKADDIKLAQETMEQAQEEAVLAAKNAQFNYESAVLTVETASNNTQTSALAYASAQEISKESEFLATKGKSSATEVLDAQISSRNAESELFSSLSAEYLALLDLRAYLVYP